ncbi:MAG: hypothetical protein IIZ28_02225 [Erysipelotrichaceae bacterium]|nr:hypothetical protein [Erysipelotrichaceae bacterium]
MTELRKQNEVKKENATTLFEDVYVCPNCGNRKIEVSTSFKDARIVKTCRCLSCDHRWNNIDASSSETLS